MAAAAPIVFVDVSKPPTFEVMAGENEDLEDEEAPPEEGEGATKPIIHEEESKGWNKSIVKKPSEAKDAINTKY